MKRLLIGLGASALIATTIVLMPSPIKGEIDLPYVNTRIDNLEARTTNNETDIKQVQATAGVTPAAHVEVPTAPVVEKVYVTASPVPAPAAAQPAPTPAPVIMINGTWRAVPFADGSADYFCDYVMPDGTTVSDSAGHSPRGMTIHTTCQAKPAN